MKIYKFGGASVKDAKSIRNVTNILQQDEHQNSLLVISAMGKMTNAFEKVIYSYCFEKEALSHSIEFIIQYHQSIINDLFDDPTKINIQVQKLFQQLNDFLQKNDSKDYDCLYDQIVCFGELLYTKIVSFYLTEVGIENTWNDVRKLIKTDTSHRDAKVNWKLTQHTILNKINSNKLNIVQGFLGGNESNITTTLGREGSDYTAGIFAYCLNAGSVTIWKDVDGVLNADPRVFEDTTLLEQISYEETIEMAFYGASVIHPKTIQPLQSKEIPLFVRSFENLQARGTKVSRGVVLKPMIPCFIVKKNQILISISTLDFSFMVENNISHVFKLLHHYQLKVNLIQNSAISFSVCVDNKFNQFDRFLEEVKSHYKVTFSRNVDLYTIRHFTRQALDSLREGKKSLLTQINKETAQVVLQEN